MLEQINRSNEENSSFANLYRVEDELYNQTGISENELVDAIKDWKLEDDSDYQEMI